jgi:hypothetical protein
MKNGAVGVANIGIVAIALVAISLFAVLNLGVIDVSGQGILEHTSAVTLSPDKASCGDIPNEFTTTVENTGGFGIYDVKIAKTQVNIDTLDCGDAPAGWNKIVDDQWFCHYRAIDPTGNATINYTQTLDFTFNATLENPEGQCNSVFVVSTLDNEGLLGGNDGEERQHRLNLSVDCEPPNTTKMYGSPRWPQSDVEGEDINTGAPYPHYINNDTEIELTAVDGGGVCAIGVDKTWYIDYIVPDSYCESEEACIPRCDQFYGQHEGCIEAGQEWCAENWETGQIANGGYDSWEECVEEYVELECGVECQVDEGEWQPWQLYNGTPFTKDEESCHILQYFSVDYHGNVEEMNHQCVNVDDTPPEANKTVGEPKLPLIEKFEYPNNGDNWWVNQDTEITLTCDDPEPHPVGNETVCFEVSYDQCESEPGCVSGQLTGAQQIMQIANGGEGTYGFITEKYCEDLGGELSESGIVCCVEGSEITFSFEEESLHDLEFYCRDALYNTGEAELEYFRVDDTPPYIEKYMFGSYLGDCPEGTDLEHGDCYVADNGQSGVEIYVTDPDTTEMGCAVNDVSCEYELWWTTDIDTCVDEFSGTHLYNFGTGQCFVEGGEFGDYKQINFTEDSTHELIVRCEDALGNEMEEHSEIFLVDSTPPETDKWFGAPNVTDWYPKGCYENCLDECYNHLKVIDGECMEECLSEECALAEFINTNTPIYMDATDNKVGVDKIWYKNVIMRGEGELMCRDPETYCNPPERGFLCCPDYPQECIDEVQEMCAANHSPYNDWYECVETESNINCCGGWDWNLYNGEPIYKDEESCHVLYYFSVDHLGNVEDIEANCFFVDDTAPEVNKTIGQPNVVKDDKVYINQNTTITLSCWDTEPHPVDHVSLWYRYRFAEECDDLELAEWFNWTDGGVYIDPYTLTKEVLFTEDSCHQLEYYCEDGLGNEGEHFFEIDIVDTKPPVITKEIVGPRHGECPPRPGTDDICYIDGVTEIHVNATDQEPHPVNEVTCDWNYEVTDGKRFGDGQQGKIPPFVIQFPEESTHVLTITCWDALGNEVTDVETFIVDKTPPETMKLYGQPRYPVEIKTDTLCYKDEGSNWQCYEELAGALADIGYTELPTGTLTYKELGPALEIIVQMSGLKNDTEYQLTLNGRDGNDGNSELGNNCPNPNGPKEGYEHAWECGTWSGGTGQEGFWNFDMTATPDSEGNFEQTYYLEMPAGHYGIGPTHDFGVGFIVKEAADVPGGSNYPPVLMEYSGLDWTIGAYNYPLWITSDTPIMLSVDDAGPHKSGIKETLYRVTQVNDDYCWGLQYKGLGCEDAEGEGAWSFFDVFFDVSFSIGEESCHLIEYYSVDNVNKTENVSKQCVFVDNQPPTPLKTVGEPRTEIEYGDYEWIYYPEANENCGTIWDCWKITTLTPIVMSCVDPEPHPVNNDEICFHVDFDGMDYTQHHCDENVGGEYTPAEQSDDNQSWCCYEHHEYNFQDGVHIMFTEESEHELEFYCVDALGNGNDIIDIEKFKVEGTAFEIPIFKKWNLISVPFQLLDDSPEEVFDNMSDEIMAVWTYDTETNTWYVYSPDGVDNDDLESIEPGWGYWVFGTNEIPEGGVLLKLGGSLFKPGPFNPVQRYLPEGWNLIGYYGIDWQNYTGFEDPCEYGHGSPYYNNVYNSLLSLMSLTVVDPALLPFIDPINWGQPNWDSLWTYNTCGIENPQEQPYWIPLGYEDLMYSGYGYWVYMNADDVYVPSSQGMENS